MPNTAPPPATVVIPTFNAAATLSRALASVEEEVEILVVDDCSSDAEQLRSIVATDPRATLISKDRRGNAAGSRALGLAQASAETVLFLDADDHMSPGYLAHRLDLHRREGSGVIIGRFRLDDGRREWTGPMADYAGGDMARYILASGGDARSSTISVRRDRLNGATFDASLRKHQDWAFVIAAQRAGATIGFDPLAGVVIDVSGGGRMSGRSDVSASLFFMRAYISEDTLQRRFLMGRLRTSVRIGDLAAARTFRRELDKLGPSLKERAASLAVIAAAHLGVARMGWRLLTAARRS